MSNINDGAPAFPQAVPPGVIGADCGPHVEWGMTLRDYFAAKALEAIIQATYGDHSDKNRRLLMENSAKLPQMLSETAYLYADAMLRERNGPRGQAEKGGAEG